MTSIISLGWPSRRCRIPGKGERIFQTDKQNPLLAGIQAYLSARKIFPYCIYYITAAANATRELWCQREGATPPPPFSSVVRLFGLLASLADLGPPPRPKILGTPLVIGPARNKEGVGHRVPVLGFLLVSFTK